MIGHGVLMMQKSRTPDLQKTKSVVEMSKFTSLTVSPGTAVEWFLIMNLTFDSLIKPTKHPTL